MPLCKWHTFWMAPCLICYSIVILFYIERKWLLIRNLATILPLKSKLSGKLQCFNAIDGSIKCWKILEFIKISIKMKNCKTFYEAQTASCFKEVTEPPPIPNPVHLSDKIFLRRYTEIYRHLLSKCFKNAVLWRQEMTHPKCFFWHQTETCLLEYL